MFAKIYKTFDLKSYYARGGLDYYYVRNISRMKNKNRNIVAIAVTNAVLVHNGLIASVQLFIGRASL